MVDNGFVTVAFQQLIDDRLLEIGDGYRAKNNELGGNGPIFLRAGHVKDSHIDFDGIEHFHAELEDKVRHKMARQGDTIVTTKGNSTGRTSFVTNRMPPFVYSPHLSYWRSADASRIESGFLRYWSRSREFTTQLAGMKASTDMAPYLSLTDQRRLKITLPPIEQQKAIAEILGALDAKIELNRRMNEMLESLARAIFKSWFVDFDPVRAKMDGRRPPGLSAEIAALFPDSFAKSELGLIPKGWKIARLDEYIKAQKGLSYKGSGLSEVGIPLHNLNSVYESGGYKHEGVKFYTGEHKDRHFVYPGDVIVTNTEQGHFRLLLGYAAVIPKSLGDRGLYSHHLYLIRPIQSSHLESYFWLHLFNLRRMHDAVSRYGNGTTVNMLPIDALQRPKFVVPPRELTDRFEALASWSFELCETHIKENRTLAALRDTLLPKLLSGELRVGDTSTSLKRGSA